MILCAFFLFKTNHNCPSCRMKTITPQQIKNTFSYDTFIPFLREYLSKEITVPQRSHFNIEENTLLLMPAWTHQFFGVKIATAFPGNRSINKPTIHAVYTLFDANTGEPIAQLDGKTLTNKRTAAASALASQYLSRADSHTLLIMGNGALCPELIGAHASVRPIKRVLIWGRNLKHVEHVIAENNWPDMDVSPVIEIEKACLSADIISCATSTFKPIVLGRYVSKGTHVDLVGSYKPDMREADNELIKKATIFIDNPAAKKESGDIYIPLMDNIIKAESIKGTLKELATSTIKGRVSRDEISLFKSVGFALEDLAAAEYLYKKQT